MAGVEFRASSKLENSTAASSFQIAIPALTDGDLMVMVVAGKLGTLATLTTPSGWTLLGSDTLQFNQGRFATYFKRKAAAEPTVDLVFNVSVESCTSVIAGFFSADGSVDVYEAGKGAVNTPNAGTSAVYLAPTALVPESDAHILLGCTFTTDLGQGLGDASGQGFTRIQAIVDTGSAVDEACTALYYDLVGSNFAEKTINSALSGYHGTQAVALTVAGGAAGGGGQAAIAAASSAW